MRRGRSPHIAVITDKVQLSSSMLIEWLGSRHWVLDFVGHELSQRHDGLASFEMPSLGLPSDLQPEARAHRPRSIARRGFLGSLASRARRRILAGHSALRPRALGTVATHGTPVTGRPKLTCGLPCVVYI